MSSSALDPPVIVIDTVDDEKPAVDPANEVNVNDNVIKVNDNNAIRKQTRFADIPKGNDPVATLKIPPRHGSHRAETTLRILNESQPGDVTEQTATLVTLTASEASKSNGSSSPRQRHHSKEEDLKHLTEEVLACYYLKL